MPTYEESSNGEFLRMVPNKVYGKPRFYFKETFEATGLEIGQNNFSLPIIIPNLSKVIYRVFPTTELAGIETTISPIEEVTEGSVDVNWVAWSKGNVTSQDEDVSDIVTAFRVKYQGTVTIEVVVI